MICSGTRRKNLYYEVAWIRLFVSHQNLTRWILSISPFIAFVSCRSNQSNQSSTILFKMTTTTILFKMTTTTLRQRRHYDNDNDVPKQPRHFCVSISTWEYDILLVAVAIRSFCPMREKFIPSVVVMMVDSVMVTMVGNVRVIAVCHWLSRVGETLFFVTLSLTPCFIF
jgi:hypothetical protein